MGKSVKVSDAMDLNFRNVKYPPGDVFVRKLDRCTVSTEIKLNCDKEVETEMQVIMTKAHRTAMLEYLKDQEKFFAQVIRRAHLSRNTKEISQKKIQAEAGSAIHERVNAKYIKNVYYSMIDLRIANEATKKLKEKFDIKWVDKASFNVKIKNLQHKKDVLRFFDSKKYVKHGYKFNIGGKINYDTDLFGPNIGKIKLDAKLTAKCVTDPKTDGEIVAKAMNSAFDEEMKSVVKKINSAMSDAKKLVKNAKNDRDKKNSVSYTQNLVRSYLMDIQVNATAGIQERVRQLAKAKKSRRTAKIMAGMNISVSIVGLGASITLMFVPVGGIGGAVTAVALTKNILGLVKSLVSAVNTLQRLNQDVKKKLKILLKAVEKMVSEFNKNKNKLETDKDSVIDHLLVCWDDVIDARRAFRLSVSAFVQKASDLEKEIQKIIRKGETANKKIVQEFMKDIPNEEQMRKDIDKLQKILTPVLTKDRERDEAIKISSDGINACSLAEKIEKDFRKKLAASKKVHAALGFVDKLVKTQVPSFKKLFSAQSTKLERVEEILKIVKAPLAAL
jgi:hypothetical protein